MRYVLALCLIACGSETNASPEPARERIEERPAEPVQPSPALALPDPPAGVVHLAGDDAYDPWSARTPRSLPATEPISGRVIAPDGRPIAGAAVQLVRPALPHGDEGIDAQVHTGSDGRFAFPSAPSWVTEMVVRSSPLARTFSFPRGWRQGPHAPVEVRISPMRRARVSLHCTEAPRTSTDPRQPIPPAQARVYWLPGEDVVSESWLADADRDLTRTPNGGASLLRPGRDGAQALASTSARSVAREVLVPPGSALVVVTSPCGIGWRQLEFEADRPPEEIAFALPAPDHASLVVELAPGSAARRLPFELYAGPARLDEGAELARGEPFRVDWLQPGPYRLARLPCRDVEIAPGTVTRVTIGRDRCDVSYERR